MDEEPPPTCRICLGESGPNKKALIHPCGCTGTIAGVHSRCLLTWINSSGSDNCELCQQRYRVETVRPTTPYNRSILWDSCLLNPGRCYLFCLVVTVFLLLIWGFVIFQCFLDDHYFTGNGTVKVFCVLAPIGSPLILAAICFYIYALVGEVRHRFREAVTSNRAVAIRLLGEDETVV